MWCLSGRAGEEEEEEDAPNVGQSSRGGDWAGGRGADIEICK